LGKRLKSIFDLAGSGAGKGGCGGVEEDPGPDEGRGCLKRSL